MRNPLKWLFRGLVGCLGTGALFAPVVLAGSQVPGIIIAEPNYNFGELSEMEPISHDFIVKNNGNTTLNIRDVQPS